MRTIVGAGVFAAGLAGLARVRLMSPTGSLGWGYWNRRQRIIGLISAAVVLAGMIVLG